MFSYNEDEFIGPPEPAGSVISARGAEGGERGPEKVKGQNRRIFVGHSNPQKSRSICVCVSLFTMVNAVDLRSLHEGLLEYRGAVREVRSG